MNILPFIIHLGKYLTVTRVCMQQLYDFHMLKNVSRYYKQKLFPLNNEGITRLKFNKLSCFGLLMTLLLFCCITFINSIHIVSICLKHNFFQILKGINSRLMKPRKSLKI